MFATRAFLLLLCVFALAGIAGSYAAAHQLEDERRAAAVDGLSRDYREFNALLRLDARARLDALAAVSVSPDVRNALRAASTRPLDEAARVRLDVKLAELNSGLGDMAAELLVLVDEKGAVVSQMGLTMPPVLPAVATAPNTTPRQPSVPSLQRVAVVQRALEGRLRDDTWVLGTEVYRVAARPVIDAGRYVGAVIHGKRFDETLAHRLAERLGGATVAFFLRGNPIGSHMPAGAPRREDLQAITERLSENENVKAGRVSEDMELPSNGLAVGASLVGSAGSAGALVAIGRAYAPSSSPYVLIQKAMGTARESVPWMILIGSAIFAFLLGNLLIFTERDRPIARFVKATLALSKGEKERLPAPEMSGPMRLASLNVNEILDRMAREAGKHQSVGDLEGVMEKLGQEEGPSFFGFASKDNFASKEMAKANAEHPTITTNALPDAPAMATPQAQPMVEEYAIPTGFSLGASSKAAPQALPPRSPIAKPALPPLGATSTMKTAAPNFASASASSVGAGNVRSPSARPPAPRGETPKIAVPAPSAARLPTPVAHDSDFLDDGIQTAVSDIPEELLRETARDVQAELDVYFRRIFQDFVAAKQQCGEPFAQLTFERFRETLRSQQEKIVRDHNAKRVRFTVYIQEGKAKLKATPIRDA